ncbi:MAG: hypothetical protein HUU37_03200 [Bdellovibrionales bacterium]|nr:hypothetical protein [Bdellovibrionales bacterium]
MTPVRQDWYVLRSGRTVGPLNAEEVIDALERREFQPGDKVSGSADRHWRAFRDDSYFRRFTQRRPRRKTKLVTPRPVAAVLKGRKTEPPGSQDAQDTRNAQDPPPRRRNIRWIALAVTMALLLSAILYFAVRPGAVDEKKGSLNEELLPPSSSPRPATDSPEDSDPGYLPRPPTRPRRL